MRILILGHGSHGKGTAAEIIEDIYGIQSCSSSWAACKEAVYPILGPRYGYSNPYECYDDRRNRREEYAQCITDYNTPDASRLARKILGEFDGYDGMRKIREYRASKHLFDRILWVDRSLFEPIDPTMDIEFDPIEMDLIDNNGSLADLENNIVSALGSPRPLHSQK